MVREGRGSERLGGLQAARAIAAILVVLQHLNWAADRIWDQHDPVILFHPGAGGVALFFVLSGYVMTRGLPRRPIDFAVGRLRRIFPGLWIALFISAGTELLLFGAWPGIDPVLFALYPTGTAPNSLVPYWTLLFELLFYGLVLVAITVFPGRSRLLVVAGLAVSFAFAPKLGSEAALFPAWDAALLTRFSLLFLIGVLLGYLPRPWGTPVALFFAFLAAALYWFPDISAALGHGVSYPSFLQWNAPYGVWAVCAGLAIYGALAWEADGLGGRVLQRIGDASYGIYLTHVVCLFVAFRLVAQMPGFADWPATAKYGVAALIGFVPAYLLGRAEWRLQKWLKTFSPARGWPRPAVFRQAIEARTPGRP
ncbi:acyltransferase [Hypericibacter adhaerens]|uniref:Acyltransferase n=1 Tax=Hypericibacter adhaerens TaxID=2602016 RepID=A0A5J6N2E5_9PROT|nr:acyltransferase [Hypericibacter adhaerens]